MNMSASPTATAAPHSPLVHRRIFIEKRNGFDVQTQNFKKILLEDFQFDCSQAAHALRHIVIYDIFNCPSLWLEPLIQTVLADAVSDKVYYSDDFLHPKAKVFEPTAPNTSSLSTFPSSHTLLAWQYLAGQLDQKAQSAMQCAQIFSSELRNLVIRSAQLLVLPPVTATGFTDERFQQFKQFCINAVESEEKDLNAPLVLPPLPQTPPVVIIEDFLVADAQLLDSIKKNLNLSLRLEDLLFAQHYFQGQGRNPTEVELKILDAYWSDHCRHSTFHTRLEKIQFTNEPINQLMAHALKQIDMGDQALTLMRLATYQSKILRSQNKLPNVEVSDEINACSVFTDVDNDGKTEKWLLQFKNETHNHPTEIEPFGGASTCVGGAIRDPLAGRAFVYQAIRVSGCANPLTPYNQTLTGKLPQKKITTLAADGFSSYGNQIGLATSLVSEIYHPNYVAKRMEVGAVVGAVPYAHIQRSSPCIGDIVLLVGGETGRDGCGAASGSSQGHLSHSVQNLSSEVQKGYAPTERSLQRLFKNPHASRLIKKCNDFGAGGVCVAVGELAHGLDIDLSAILTKYSGLGATELATSESQERMAVLVDPKDAQSFIELAKTENLQVTPIATVTSNDAQANSIETARLIMRYRGQVVVDLARAFLETNGAPLSQSLVCVDEPSEEANPFKLLQEKSSQTPHDCWQQDLLKHAGQLENCSQQGLASQFDYSVGAATVLAPFGGKMQQTPIDASVHKFPTQGFTHTASAITWGFNPYISSYSPYHGAMWAVLESCARLVATGVDYKNVYYSFQEYFPSLRQTPNRWGQPLAALLGANQALHALEQAAIGGKDSMSGSFNDIDVPPTLISFAVATLSWQDVVSPEFKAANRKLYWLRCPALAHDLPDFECFKTNSAWLHQHMQQGAITSCKSIRHEGLLQTIALSILGNGVGADIVLAPEFFFSLQYGSFLIEANDGVTLNFENLVSLGNTLSSDVLRVNGASMNSEDFKIAWKSTLEPVFSFKHLENKDFYNKIIANKAIAGGLTTPKSTSPTEETAPETIASTKSHPRIQLKLTASKPRVLLPVFIGTNSELDTHKAFEQAGFAVNQWVFLSQTPSQIQQSIEHLQKAIAQSEIVCFAGGFSASDEPDGAGKYIATILKNTQISDAIASFLEKDRLILGICNGFQALIKTGLIAYSRVQALTPLDATLTFNTSYKHVSHIVQTRISSTRSPWFYDFNVGDIHDMIISHGEGCLYAPLQTLQNLRDNDNISTQYFNETQQVPQSPNGSSWAIEALCDASGKILGKMGHSERFEKGTYKNFPNFRHQNIFASAMRAFK